MNTTKKTALWTGVAVTGLLGVVLLGGGKIQSGTLLILTAFALAQPAARRRLPLWLGVALVGVLYGLVAWNISTTELPDPSAGMMSCEEHSEWYDPTGIRFVDQLMWILSGFTAQAAPS
ncbi:hypothetical protein GCM10009830_30020 [Glycomyces endophyticus]|uniref:O-antigen ligase domain-containing protein n=1 Tax=Glycomyces endophyticus TaxID=480996 RepID=A0ABN2H2Q4_9ACTN